MSNVVPLPPRHPPSLRQGGPHDDGSHSGEPQQRGGRPGRRVFRPGLWGAVFGGGAILALLWLGTWQVERLEWKRGVLAHIHQRLESPVADLPAALPDPEAWDYRPVRLTGTFDHGHEIHIGARTANGNVGYEIVTPLVRADGQGVVLVDRGWVPTNRRDPQERPQGQVAGTVTVTGVARVPPPKFWAQPDNRPAENFWLYYDLPAMAAFAGVDHVAPVVVQADATPNPGGYPLGGQTRVNIPNDHLQYAITWYLLAIALAVICWMKFTRVEGDEEAGAEPRGAEGRDGRAP